MTTAARVAERFKTGMKEMTFEDLPDAQKKLVTDLGIKPKDLMLQGGHGGIVLTYMNRAVPANRLDAAFLKTLLRHPTFRWIEASDNWVSIGC